MIGRSLVSAVHTRSVVRWYWSCDTICLHNIVKFNSRTARVIVWFTSLVYISMAEVYPKSTDMSRAV